MGKFYKVKHENIIGKSRVGLNDEELTELLDKHLELNGLNKDFDNFETEREFFTWYENQTSDLEKQIESGIALDCGDYSVIYE